MRRLTIALIVALSACGGGGGNGDNNSSQSSGDFGLIDMPVEAMTVITGYQPATKGTNTIYVPDNIDTTKTLAENNDKFSLAGQAFQMWAGVVAANTDLSPNGNAIVTHQFNMRLHYGSPTQVANYCTHKGGPDTVACTTPNNGGVCEIYISTDHPYPQWGHQLWHCINGNFHG